MCGIIFDCNGEVLVVSVLVEVVWVDFVVIYKEGGLVEKDCWYVLVDVFGLDC